MNHAFERLLKRIDDELNQDVLPDARLLARGQRARELYQVGDHQRVAWEQVLEEEK